MLGHLQLPGNAASTLERAHRSDADIINVEDKWLIYTIDHAPPQAKELAHLATNYWCQTQNHPEGCEHILLKPAVQVNTTLSLQDALDYHLNLCGERLEGAEGRGEEEQQCYVFGFIALTRSDWKEHGVTVVHCDRDRGKWKAEHQSGIPVGRLGFEMTRLSLNSMISANNESLLAKISWEVQPEKESCSS